MNVLKSVIRFLAFINRNIGVAARHFSVGLIISMTVIILAQVFFRYVINSSLTWSEELAKLMMIWLAFLIAPLAYRWGANVSIEIILSLFKKRWLFSLRIVLNLLVLWILYIFLNESFGLVERGQKIRASSIPVQMSYFYSIVPISFSALMLVNFELVLRDLVGLISPTHYEPVPLEDIIQDEPEVAEAPEVIIGVSQ